MNRIFRFSQNSGQHRSLTTPFEPFQLWLRIRGDTHRCGESTTPRIGDSGSRYLIKFYKMKKISLPVDLYVCLLLQVSLVPAVVSLWRCWRSVVGIPAFARCCQHHCLAGSIHILICIVQCRTCRVPYGILQCILHLRPNFLGRNWDKRFQSFPPCYLQSPLLQILLNAGGGGGGVSKILSTCIMKLDCNVNIVYGSLKLENPQDYAQKPQLKCTFMNSPSGKKYRSPSTYEHYTGGCKWYFCSCALRNL